MKERSGREGQRRRHTPGFFDRTAGMLSPAVAGKLLFAVSLCLAVPVGLTSLLRWPDVGVGGETAFCSISVSCRACMPGLTSLLRRPDVGGGGETAVCGFPVPFLHMLAWKLCFAGRVALAMRAVCIRGSLRVPCVRRFALHCLAGTRAVVALLFLI